MGLALDSSVLIDIERSGRKLKPAVADIGARFADPDLIVSAITVAELEHGIWRADPARRPARLAFLENVLASLPVQPMDVEVARLVGKLDAELRLAGMPVQFADLCIAACAMRVGFGLITINMRHFSRIPGLRVERL